VPSPVASQAQDHPISWCRDAVSQVSAATKALEEVGFKKLA
jgi:hypothetical protein